MCQILLYPSKHFLFSKTSWRCLEDVFSITLFVFQDVFKTSLRRLPDVFAIRLPEMSPRRLPRRLQDVFKTSLRYLPRRLQDVFKTCLQDVLLLCLQDVFKTFSRCLGRQKNVTLKTSSKRLQAVFSTSSPRRMFAGLRLTKFFLVLKKKSVFFRNTNGHVLPKIQSQLLR